MDTYRLTIWFDGVIDFVTVQATSEHQARLMYDGEGEITSVEEA